VSVKVPSMSKIRSFIIQYIQIALWFGCRLTIPNLGINVF
jgi:hypothetical protein